MTGEETGTPPAPDPRPAALDRAAVRAEMDSARLDFHRLIDDATPADLRRPIGLVNYLGSCTGARIISPRHMTKMLDRVIATLQQHLQRETGSPSHLFTRRWSWSAMFASGPGLPRGRIWRA